MSFISYYFHWSEAEVMDMEHAERLRWCREISDINRQVNGDDKKKNIFDV